MSKVRLKLTRSTIGKSKKQKETVLALGLRKTNQVVEKEVTPQVMGMINKIKHLVEVEQI